MSLSPAPQDTAIIGSSPAFLDLMDRVSQVARLDRPVLVIGERGTGKEIIAARLHFLSRRWEYNLVKMNCAALPETLLESELFGYEAGAFTGATRRHAGRFEVADQGTLFLDEIATMSMAAQEKLLRVIEYGEYERLGGSETLFTDARIVGATNVDLPSLADAGAFRHDLLDRLAFDVLTVPPLRARTEDIIDLAFAFGKGMASDLGWTRFPGFSDEVCQHFLDYPWPGNVRELKNAAERAVYRWADDSSPIDAVVFDPFDSPFRPQAAVKSKSIAPEPLPASSESPAPAISVPDDLRQAVADYERAILARAYAEARYNQRDTGQMLGLSYDQVRHALKKYDLL